MARASIQDIADIAGVSKMTVSRVLRGEGGSRHQERILEVARSLDYIPVRPMLQNRRVRTNVIGVLEEGPFLFDSLIGAQTFGGVAQTAFDNGYDMMLLRPQHDLPLEQRKVQFLDRRCDGFIFIVPKEFEDILALLVQNEIPAVTCYTDEVPEGVSWITPDNEQAVQDAVSLLVNLGHRHIAFWNGPQGHSDARERTRAFTKSMRDANLTLYQHNYIWESADDEKERPQELSVAPDIKPGDNILETHVTAVICHNDQRALILWEEASALGLRVPEDLSIIGIDDTTEARERGLTTLRNSFSDIGSAAADALNSLINGGSPEDNCRRIPMPLVERSSTAPPRKQLRLKP